MYMVFFDDKDCLNIPMGWDADCEGAICTGGTPEPVIFPNRKSAQKSIAISTAFAKLCAAQGKPANTDFTTSRKNVVIRKCVLAEQEGTE